MFAKGFALDVLLGSECTSAMCMIMISLWIFLRNLFCYFLVCGDSKLFLWQLFRFFMKLIHLHYSSQKTVLQRLMTSFNLFLNNWGTEIIGIRPYVSTWCPNIKKMNAHKLCILWSPLNLSSIPYEKNYAW